MKTIQFINPLVLILLILATWRVSNLLVEEDGPFHIFRWLRERTGMMHDQDGIPFQIPDRFFANLLSCVWCTSVWVGIGFAVFWLFLPSVALVVAFPLALSAGAIIVNKFVKG